MTDSDQTEGHPDRPEPATPGRTIADRTLLYRSEEDRILGGVAAGVADHFDADPVTVRLLWVLLVLFGGIGILAYLVLWIVLPPYSRVYGEIGSAHRGADASTGHAVPPTGKRRSPVRSDLVLGGIPLSILAGKRDVMRTFSPLGGGAHSGTYTGHLVGVMAARAVPRSLPPGFTMGPTAS